MATAGSKQITENLNVKLHMKGLNCETAMSSAKLQTIFKSLIFALLLRFELIHILEICGSISDSRISSLLNDIRFSYVA